MTKQRLLLPLALLTLGLTAATPPKGPRDPKKKFIDPQNMDQSVRPGDNFYQYANGTWLRNNPVPASKTRWGSFNLLREQSSQALRTLLEDATRQTEKGRTYQMVGDFYASGMDSLAVEQRGYEPIRPVLERVESVTDWQSALTTMGELRKQGYGMLFGFYVGQDRKNVNRYIPQLGHGGLTLPDRDYYLKNDARSQTIRTAYRDHLGRMFSLIGAAPETAQQQAGTVLRLETALARAQYSRVELRDPYKTYNKFTLTDLNRQTPHLNWTALLTQFGAPGQDTVLVANPGFLRTVDSLLTSTPVADLKTYMRWNILKSAAPYLSHAFVKQNFELAKVLTGQKEQTPRWQRVSGQVDSRLGDLLGQLYVERYFKPEAKARMLTLVDNLEASFTEHINALDWMSPDTRQRALTKLTAFKRKIGYPDKWETYDGLAIQRDDYYGNIQRANQWDYNYMITRLGKPVDRTRWGMTPPTINAYYSPINNEIAFPAGILQFPFFDPEADDAVNYGGIGAVIGHEMTHGFDDSGRQYDADGTLRDWWTKEDADQFKKRADKVVAQFFGYKVLDSLSVNGRLTLGENLADLGGLAIAYDAFKKTKQGQSKAKIDGFTPDQRFFLSWAQIWRENALPEFQAQQIMVDSHSPGMYRCNGPVSNLDAWYEAFGVKAGDKLYKPKEERIKVW